MEEEKDKKMIVKDEKLPTTEEKATTMTEQNNKNPIKSEELALKIMIDKEQDIKSTISLLRKEIAVVSSESTPTLSSSKDSKNTKTETTNMNQLIPNKTEFNGLSSFLADDGVKEMIKSIAGENTKKLIDITMTDVNSKKSVDEKHIALTNGIKKLQSNLREANTLNNKNDPTLNLAFSLLGLKKERLI